MKIGTVVHVRGLRNLPDDEDFLHPEHDVKIFNVYTHVDDMNGWEFEANPIRGTFDPTEIDMYGFTLNPDTTYSYLLSDIIMPPSPTDIATARNVLLDIESELRHEAI